MMKLFRRKAAPVTAQDILEQILEARPQATAMAPKDCRGVYGLVDHHGDLRYIGSTKSAAETFYKRIHQRHRTGSETSSHYFSRMYNTGRMWRLRNDPATVRRQGFWNQWQLKLRERLAHLVGFIMRH